MIRVTPEARIVLAVALEPRRGIGGIADDRVLQRSAPPISPTISGPVWMPTRMPTSGRPRRLRAIEPPCCGHRQRAVDRGAGIGGDLGVGPRGSGTPNSAVRPSPANLLDRPPWRHEAAIADM